MLCCWLGVGVWVICQSYAALALALADEHFNEGLHIRPLQDGRLYTHFSFSTILTGAAPRSPATLNEDDEREPARQKKPTSTSSHHDIPPIQPSITRCCLWRLGRSSANTR